MTTTTPTALARMKPAFNDREAVALAGFLAGYRGLTRDAYALDLRQYATWCLDHDLGIFDARRMDIEGFARELEAKGRARSTVARRLCTVTAFSLWRVLCALDSRDFVRAFWCAAGNGPSIVVGLCEESVELGEGVLDDLP